MTSRKPGRRKKNEGDEEFKLTESQEEEEEEEEESSDDSSSKPKGAGRPKPGRRSKKGGDSTASDDGGASDDGKKQSVQRKQTTSRRKPRRQNTFVMSAAGDVSGGAVKKIPKIVVRNPTKKTVVIHGKQVAQEGFLSPPKVRRVRSKKKAAPGQKPKRPPKDDNKKEKGGNKENENEFYEDIDLLSKLPLPSTYFRHRFNQNIATIGSINIQAFGTKKASSNVLMHIITDLLRRYDIVLCQEIHAPEDHEDVIEQLCEEVSTPSTPYSYVASKPLGRGKYVERYVYLYRTKEWKVLNQYVIDDEKLGDKFARDPFVVKFQHWRKPDVRINLVGCHTQPENAFEEVIALVEDVYDIVKSGIKPVTTRTSEKPIRSRAAGIEDEPLTAFQIFMNVFCCCLPKYTPVSTRDIPELTKETWKVPVQTTTEPIIMMGDFNAAGSYVNKSKRAELDAILQSKNLVWGIQNTTDTTVSDGSDAAYDRFIFEEENERRWVGKTGVWRFDDGWLQGKDDTTLIKRAAKRVSDHYPIEFELKLV